MANKKSSAQQAIKDMLEAGIDVSFFMMTIREYHILNAEIGIVTKEKAKPKPKVKKEKVYVKPAPKCKPRKYTHVYNRRLCINPDGTVSIEFSEWDYK